jgi:hypothetical protein
MVIFASILIYCLRLVKPEIAKDEDIIFASSGVLYSLILFLHGWRLDPILLLSQIGMVVVLFYLGYENIKLRGYILHFQNITSSQDKN